MTAHIVLHKRNIIIQISIMRTKEYFKESKVFLLLLAPHIKLDANVVPPDGSHIADVVSSNASHIVKKPL